MEIFDQDGDVLLHLWKPRTSESTENLAHQRSLTEHDGRWCDKSLGMPDSVIKVSGKHLSLASPVFSSMIECCRRKQIEAGSNGPVVVKLPDDFPAAVHIIICMIHNKTLTLPYEVDLNLLLEISLLVAKYKLLDVVGYFTLKWIRAIHQSEARDVLYNDKIPDIWSSHTANKLCAWLCISWVFGYEAEFKQVTHNIIKTATNLSFSKKIRDARLPVPEPIIQRISDRHREIDQELTAIMNEYIRAYRHDSQDQKAKNQCTRKTQKVDCDTMVLGSLNNLANNLHLERPSITCSHQTNDTISLFDYRRLVEENWLHSLCKIQPVRFGSSKKSPCLSVRDQILIRTEHVNKRLHGLELAEFFSVPQLSVPCAAVVVTSNSDSASKALVRVGKSSFGGITEIRFSDELEEGESS